MVKIGAVYPLLFCLNVIADAKSEGIVIYHRAYEETTNPFDK